MSGLLIFNNQSGEGESFQGADIVEIFPTVSATFLATASPTRTSIVSAGTTLTPPPSITVSQPLQDSGQAGSPPSTAVSGSPASRPPTTPIPTSTLTPTPELTPTPSEHPNNSSASNILISEIQVGGVDAGDEFIELYTPTNSEIDVSSWSIQYLTGSTTDITKTVKKNFQAGDAVPAHGFFLIARAKDSSGKDGYIGNIAPDLTHRSFSLSGASTGGKIFLVNDAVKIDSLTDANIVDTIDYSFLVPENGKSLERKDYTGNFELRNSPNPQNTQNQL